MKLEVLSAYDSQRTISKSVKVPETQIVHSVSDIKINTPLVLKIISPQAVHKTEINGVRIVNHKTEIESAFNELITISKKNKLKVEGILVQEFVDGQQFIIGIKKDSVFGHVILFGLGGIFAEVLNDTVVRKCPINIDEAQSMLNELKAEKIFHNFRNIKLNTTALKESLVAISKIPLKNQNISEMDINPYILNSKEGKAVDVRIIIEK